MAAKFRGEWLRWGYGVNGTRLRIDPRRHLLERFGNAPAWPVAIIQWYTEHRIGGPPEKLVASFTDGTVLWIPFTTFVQLSVGWERPGFEPQMVCERRWWRDSAAPVQESLL